MRIKEQLVRVTEVLASRLSAPEIPVDCVWTAQEWQLAKAAATLHGIAPLLQSLPWVSPRDWRDFLDSQRCHVEKRHFRIASTLDSLDDSLQRRGLAVMTLKGVALHAYGVYQAGDRPMADIDILTRCAADMDELTQVLDREGFGLQFANWRHAAFVERSYSPSSLHAAEHSTHPIKIEVHTAIAERLPVATVDITPLMNLDSMVPGLNLYPSELALQAHLLLHAAGNMRPHALRFVQLYDIAMVAARLKPSQWSALVANEWWWAAPPLCLVARYFRAAIPKEVLDHSMDACHWWLRHSAKRRRRMSEVSWSNSEISAFPGIEWCRNLREASAYVLQRFRPTKEIREELSRYAKNEIAAGAVPWYELSQSARIIKWCVARPPRIQTMHTVNAALRGDL